MSAHWLSKELSTLLASPHISFPKTQIRLGPGPIDLFSTNFNNLFVPDVEVTVDGKKASRDELKQKLLNLQKHWKPEEVKFQDEPTKVPNDLETIATLSPGQNVSFLAQTEQKGGKTVIKKFCMNGAASLFQ